MKLLFPFPLLALAALAPALLPREDPAPEPAREQALFTASVPRAAKPVAKGSPAWDAKVALEAKGLPLRAVLAGVLDQAGVSYAIDPALDATVYVSVKETTLRDAVAVLARVCDFELRADGGVWYAVKAEPKPAEPKSAEPKSAEIKPAKVATKTVKPIPTGGGKTLPADPFSDPTLAITPLTGPISRGGVSRGAAAQSIVGEDVKTDRQRFPVGASALPRTALPKTAAPKVTKSKPTKPATIQIADPKTDAPDLAKRVTTKLPKADLRAVFAAFSTQTGVGIAVDESVPRYKVDAYLKATSLKYALNEVTKAAGLVWTVEGDAIRISKRD